MEIKSAKVNHIPTVQEGTVKVPGGNIWYLLVGAGKKGVPLLTVHGGPGAPHEYLNPLKALAEERPVVFYDQLGCGHSDRPSDLALWTVEHFVEELDLLRKALYLNQVHILGQSWGSMLAVEYMLRKEPSGVKSLILSGPYLSSPLWSRDQRYWRDQLPAEIRQIILECEDKKTTKIPPTRMPSWNSTSVICAGWIPGQKSFCNLWRAWEWMYMSICGVRASSP